MSGKVVMAAKRPDFSDEAALYPLSYGRAGLECSRASAGTSRRT
jgi:hypothetical protein